jgi:hypothetical protein
MYSEVRHGLSIPGREFRKIGLKRFESGLADPKELPPNPKITWQENSIG